MLLFTLAYHGGVLTIVSPCILPVLRFVFARADQSFVHSGLPIRVAPPGDDHGADVDAAGGGTVTDQRLYQLVRQNGTITDRTFEIRFLALGVQASDFTFG